MTLKLNCFLMTEDAEVMPDGTLRVGRLIDNVNMTLSRRLEPNERLQALGLPPFIFVATFEGSIADGLVHSLAMEFVDEDEETIAPKKRLSDIVFSMNALGRPLRHNQVIRIQGLQVPAAGDYAARLYVDEELKATYTFYVTLIEPNG